MASSVLDVHTQLESSYEEHVEALAIGNIFGIPLDFVGPAVREVDFGRPAGQEAITSGTRFQ